MAWQLFNRIRFFFVGHSATLIFLALACSGLAAQDLSQQGAQAMRTGRFREAEQIYRQLVQQFPRDAGWHGNLGLALHSQGKYKEAAEALELSLKLRPSAGIAAVLGVDYLKLGDGCRAIAPLEQTDKLEALADANAACKRYRSAAQLYEKLSKPRLAAHAYWQARDYSDARRVFAAIEAQYRGEPEFNYEYGDTLLRSEGAGAAIAVLERATSLIEGRAALGKAYVEAGRFKDAIPHLEAAVMADSDLFLPLSRAYKAIGRAAEADRAMSEYRKQRSNR